MPLRHHRLLADLDLGTRIALSKVYLEVCQELDTPSISVRQLDKLRSELGERIVQLALAGETDPDVIRRKVLRSMLVTKPL